MADEIAGCRLGQPVRQHRPIGARTWRPRARKSGSRPAGASTPSSRPAAPAARSAACPSTSSRATPACARYWPIRRAARLYEYVRNGALQGDRLAARSPRASASAASPPTCKDAPVDDAVHVEDPGDGRLRLPAAARRRPVPRQHQRHQRCRRDSRGARSLAPDTARDGAVRHGREVSVAALTIGSGWRKRACWRAALAR